MTWDARMPWWYNTPWLDEYYPWQTASYPWLLENENVDWTPRTPVTP